MPNGTQHGVAAERLHKEPSRPMLDRFAGLVRVRGAGADEDRQRRIDHQHPPNRSELALPGRGDPVHDEFRFEIVQSRDGVESVLGLSDDLVPSVREDLPEQTAHEYMIFDDEDAGHGFGVLSGIGRHVVRCPTPLIGPAGVGSFRIDENSTFVEVAHASAADRIFSISSPLASAYSFMSRHSRMDSSRLRRS
jgi:hypothetical protein